MSLVPKDLTHTCKDVDAIRRLKAGTHVDDADAFPGAQYVASLRDYVPGKRVQ